MLVGRSVDRRVLAKVERSTGVLMRLETVALAHAATPRDRRVPVAPDARRRLAHPRAGRGRGGRRRDATVSSLLLVGGAGLLIVTGLMLVLSRLLRRSVVRPVESLRAAMQQVEGGDYAARVAPSGAGEIRTLVGGFNDMATLVEAQRDRLQALAESDR